jgi:hypothetical protein
MHVRMITTDLSYCGLSMSLISRRTRTAVVKLKIMACITKLSTHYFDGVLKHSLLETVRYSAQKILRT